MRDRFFKLYIDIKVTERYYCIYVNRAVFWNSIITGVCLFGSAATISSWAVWNMIPIVWAVIIALSQVLATFRPLMKTSARLAAAKYLLPDLQRLSDDATSYWDEINLKCARDSLDDDSLLDTIKSFRERLTMTREKYAPSDLFPENSKYKKLAENDAVTYFSVQYDIEMEDIKNANSERQQHTHTA